MSISLENPLIQTYFVYATLLCLKVLIMSLLTGRQRMIKNVFANAEDARNSKSKIKLDDVDVERVRRAHLNDLENIPVFLIVCLMYILTEPAAGLAVNLIRLYTLTRCAHTIVYAVVVIPQPARAIAFIVGYLITWYMGVQVLLKFIHAL